MILKIFSIVCFCLSAVSCLKIQPIYSGSIEVQDKVLRLNTCIFRKIDLPYTKESYELPSKAKVIATISSLSMDQNLSLQFHYSIQCPNNQCILDFVLQRKTPIVSPFMSYTISINFLIARGLIIKDLNMTYYKISFNAQKEIKEVLDLQNQVQQQGEWVAYLIPNGFNNISLTGFITQSLIPNSNRYALEFRDQSEMFTVGDSMGWTTHKKFIVYKILLLPKHYLNELNCISQISSEKCLNVEIFSGFLSTTAKKITMDSFQSHEQVDYSTISIPFLKNQIFKDERPKPKTLDFTVLKDESMPYIWYSLIVIILLMYLLFKRHLIAEKPLKDYSTQSNLENNQKKSVLNQTSTSVNTQN